MKKPYPTFPLTAHKNGQWCKKILGRIHYFGTDQDEALILYLADKDYLHAGIVPPSRGDTLADILNDFIERKQVEFDDGEITERTYNDYLTMCHTIADTLGKTRSVSGLNNLKKLRTVLGKGKKGQKLSSVTHKRLLTYARMVFYHANERMGLSIRYKDDLKPPSAKSLRKARNERGPLLYTSPEVKKLIDASNGELKSMMWLAINCGMGDQDMDLLPWKYVSDWHTFPRPKTEMPRRCKLWDETIEALPEKDGLFVFQRGWNRFKLGREFKKIAESVSVINHGFYTLRRTFRTVAKAGVGIETVNSIMGHVPRGDDMGAVYNQCIYDKELIECTDHVKGWLDGDIELK